MSSRDGGSQIYSMLPDGSHVARLTNDPALDYMPQLSPDRTRVAFTSNRDGDWKVYVMNVDGSDVHLVSVAGAPLSQSPSWSPDGRHIAYDSFDGSEQDVWTVDPDGTRIVFDAGDPNIGIPSQLFTINADGSDRAELLAHQTGSEDALASYSPDGSRIIFESTRGGATLDLYTIRSDGTDLERLTNGPGGNSGPSWR